MSWMDSWSRPSKSQSTPAPFYLLPGGESTPYCKSCGRVISQRKSQATKTTTTPAKYCSDRCRHQKPGKVDREIERAFVQLLNGEEKLPEDAGVKKGKGGKKQKGDPRILVSCDAVEKHVFGVRSDPEKAFGRKKNRKRRGAPDDPEWKTVDMVSDESAHEQETDASLTDDDKVIAEIVNGEGEKKVEVVDGDLLARMSIRSGTRIRPSQEVSEVNGSVGGEKGRAERIEENEEMLEKRREGQKRAEEREKVRCAARRGVAFGFVVKEGNEKEQEERRKCEAVMLGKVVEPSYAKGDWSVRWREE